MEQKVTAGAMYSSLPVSVETHSTQLGLKPSFTKDKKKAFIAAFLKKSIPKNYHQQIDDDAMQHKCLLLDKHKKVKKKKTKPRKKKTISSKERKALKLFKLKKDGHRFGDYVALQVLWQEYIKEVIDFKKLTKKNMHATEETFLKSDLHGAILTVQRSLCPSYVGTSGIVLQESRNTFRIITKGNRLKTIPKLNSVFTTEVAGFVFTIHGNHFRVKPYERVNKKFKRKSTTDL
ncbi:ribonuclease P protein subunit p29-like [Gigantopelta aegis]|uniref:ribonuclease P protein subunit p29-like n=1 Tax=Gigantopelta aegis TaxID=1735272 RepID=UPI001B887BC4|nr:ribonuclease P protein subunit p29-like [Gigantopelta aegis]